jgi:hypothetical protein
MPWLETRLPHRRAARPHHGRHTGCHPCRLPQHGRRMVRQQPVPMGNEPLRWWHRKRQAEHHLTHILQQMARVRRPRHPEPGCEETNQAIRRVRHRALQAHARWEPRRAHNQNPHRPQSRVRRGGEVQEEVASQRRSARSVQSRRLTREEAAEQSPQPPCHGRLLVETRYRAIRPHDLLYPCSSSSLFPPHPKY